MTKDFTELDALLDSTLSEFGSMGGRRLRRVAEALRKKAKAGGVAASPGLLQNQQRTLYKMKDGTARMIKSKGGVPSFDPYARKGVSAHSFSQVTGLLDSTLSEFADRSRDDAGRYTVGGSVASVDDFRAAHMARPKRKPGKRAAGIAAATAVGATGLYAINKGVGSGSRAAYGVARAIRKKLAS